MKSKMEIGMDWKDEEVGGVGRMHSLQIDAPQVSG